MTDDINLISLLNNFKTHKTLLSIYTNNTSSGTAHKDVLIVEVYNDVIKTKVPEIKGAHYIPIHAISGITPHGPK